MAGTPTPDRAERDREQKRRARGRSGNNEIRCQPLASVKRFALGPLGDDHAGIPLGSGEVGPGSDGVWDGDGARGLPRVCAARRVKERRGLLATSVRFRQCVKQDQSGPSVVWRQRNTTRPRAAMMRTGSPPPARARCTSGSAPRSATLICARSTNRTADSSSRSWRRWRSVSRPRTRAP